MANMEWDMKVTDEMVNIAWDIMAQTPNNWDAIRKALEAVFDHIEDKRGKVKPEDRPINVLCTEGGLMHECRMDDKICIFCGKDLSKKVKPEEKRDGWIAHDGKRQPVDEGAYVEVRYRNPTGNEIRSGRQARNYYWLDSGQNGAIIAYRIISEEKEEKCEHIMENCEDVAFCKNCGAIDFKEEKPTKRKQTLLELINKEHGSMYKYASDEIRWLAQVTSEHLEQSEG